MCANEHGAKQREVLKQNVSCYNTHTHLKDLPCERRRWHREGLIDDLKFTWEAVHHPIDHAKSQRISYRHIRQNGVTCAHIRLALIFLSFLPKWLSGASLGHIRSENSKKARAFYSTFMAMESIQCFCCCCCALLCMCQDYKKQAI